MHSTVYYGALSKSNNGGVVERYSTSKRGAWVTLFTLDPSNPNRIVAGYKRFQK